MKNIFFVTPIGSKTSDERRDSDFVMNNFITPVANDLDYQVLRSDLINTVNKVDDDVVNQVISSDLVIIDITKLNPNVMFEFGIRYGVNKPFIVISQSLDDIPFDVRNIRTLQYTVVAPDIIEFNQKLKNTIRTVMDNESNKGNDSNALGEKLGEQMALEALQSGDMSKIKNFIELAKDLGIDPKNN